MPGRGRYHYALDGREQAIDEFHEWQRDGGEWRLSGERRIDGALVFDIDAVYAATGNAPRCRSMRLRWHSATTRVARYRLDAAVLHWRIDEQDGGCIELAAGGLMFPLLRAATGPLLANLLDGPRPVVVPRLHDPAAADFLHPLQSQRRVDVMTGAGGDAQHLRYYGGEYGDAGCDCWLDAGHRLLRYRWASPQGLWDVRLD